MMGDDLYQNDGDTFTNGTYYPGVPEERTEAEQAEQAPAAASFPIMGQVATWFQAQADSCDNMHNIQVTSLTVNGVKYSREVSVEGQVLAYQLLKEMLQDKANEFAKFKEAE